MKRDRNAQKLFVIAIIGAACWGASLLVLRTVAGREQRFDEAKNDIAGTWGNRQVVFGPLLVVETGGSEADGSRQTFYILPATLYYETELEPEKRSRGIFSTPVYTGRVKISGTFSAADMPQVVAAADGKTARIAVAVTDTRGIEKQLDFKWQEKTIPFEPGSDIAALGRSGLHGSVPVDTLRSDVSFSFMFDVKGSEGISFAPIGRETLISALSVWKSPKFFGSFLPAEHSLSASGFAAQWRISSFGRSYPQAWENHEVDFEDIVRSAAGVDLFEHADLYTKLFRSIKYAVLFIAVTFLAFFLFETLAGVRIHPLQYALVGAALSLFYLLLLSLAEHVGFFVAYVIATLMTASLISLYSARVLIKKHRAVLIFAALVALYGYLYFVLLLEEYALLFGSLLLFVLLASLMYLTRNVNWFEAGVTDP
ncbi:MAG: cell envelope integrity protein CreD [bacterium]|nr:cell envelope integrity protein CreD [bacterium]MDZ4284761.1 cell envelope integrity protein CreD [Patescibacteria group bacterium]